MALDKQTSWGSTYLDFNWKVEGLEELADDPAFNIIALGEEWRRNLPAIMRLAVKVVKDVARQRIRPRQLPGGKTSAVFVGQIKGSLNKPRFLSGFRVGVFASSPVAAYAGLLDTGTKTFNAESYFHDLTGRMAIPITEEARQAGSPRAESGGVLVFVKFKRRHDSPAATIVGALIRREDISEWNRQSAGGHETDLPPAQFLIATRVAVHPTHWLEASIEPFADVAEEGVAQFWDKQLESRGGAGVGAGA